MMPHHVKRALFATLMVAAVLPSGTVAAAPMQLTISYSQKTVDFLPLFIATDAGYFKNHGLDVSVRYLPAQEGIPALVSGQEQMAGIGGSDAASAEVQGVKLKAVVTLTPTYIFQFWARPDHATASTLKGQRVGITSTTGSLYAATLLCLKQLGLTSADVVMTPLGGVTNVNNSLLSGSIVAAASHPPATYKFQRAGLVDLVDLAKKNIPSINAGIWTNQPFIQTHRDVVQNVADAIVEAIRREKTDRAFAESEISKYLGVKDKGELDFTYGFYVNEVLAAGPIPQVAQIQSNIDAMAAKNPKVKTIDAATMVDQSFVTQAEKKLSSR
jgi:NitT/TauT family transport system substrate-binding protein